MTIEFPEKLRFLFKPKRYKVAHGGRGSAKSWSFARALLIQGAERKLRILCTREVQKSIKDSVHKLLSDQIEALGLGDFYEILDTEIRGANGTEFTFAGLAQHTVESVKSYEGVDICWIEEAQNVSKFSWEILLPTIRKEGSEIWISFNPMLDTDETWVRFVENPHPDSVVVQVNYSDNPWFSDVLEQERLHCFATNPTDYPNIWEGKCRTAVIGAIYAGEVGQAILDDRIRPVPYDPRKKVHAIWDLGFNDSMAIIMVQSGAMELRVIDYIEDNRRTLESYVGELKAKNYNWGYDYLPHDGFSSDYKSGTTADKILRSMGRRVMETPNIGIENGIKAARSLFPAVYFDKSKTARLIECLKRYRRTISRTGAEGAPLHDEYSNGADAFRYLGVVGNSLSNEDEYTRGNAFSSFGVIDSVAGY